MPTNNHILTFLDSGVLLSAWRSDSSLRLKALSVLAAADRRFVSSDFVALEILPKAVYHKNRMEVAFHQRYLAAVHTLVANSDELLAEARKVAEKYGLNGMDALHIAAALIAQADEFITSERPTSPLTRVRGIKVRSLRAK